MADEQVTPVEPVAEPEESLAAFVARENALERGETVPEPALETPAEPEATVELEAPAQAAAPKVDKRTKEGRKLTIQQEIDQLTARRYQAKAEADAEEVRLQNLRLQQEQARARSLQPPQQPQPAAPKEDKEPQLADFNLLPDGSANPDPYSAYMRALARWDARQIVREASQQAAAQTHEASVAQAWGAKIAEIKQTVPDIEQRLSQTPIDKRVWPFVQNHAQGVEIARYLSENLPEAQALLRLHPIDQIGRIGEIVGRLSSRAAAAPVAQRRPPAVSAAKPPIQPLGTSPVAALPEPDDDEPFSAFFERENKAERKRGAR